MGKRQDPERAFGAADRAFVERVRRTINQLQQEEIKPMKKKLSLGLAAALAACVMMVAVAMAAANAWGIRDLLTRHGGEVLPAAQDIVTRPEGVSASTGHAAFTVRESSFDGRTIFLAVAARPIDADALPLGSDTYPGDPISDLGPLFEGQTGTVAEYAAKNGKKLLHTNVGLRPDKADDADFTGWSIDFLLEEDGTLVYLISAPYAGDKAELSMDIACVSAPFDGDGYPADAIQRVSIPYQFKAAQAMDVARGAPNAEYPQAGVRVDRVTLTATPMAIYTRVEYTVIDQAAFEATGDGLWFEFVDEAGERLPGGAADSGEVREIGGGAYLQTGSLRAAEQLPAAIGLRACNASDKARYETRTIELTAD
ncbi:MAG: hypothetical protein GX558_07080 [Clostridiales bacterium]|nr:hypothetical protein [Clostridiales bacterium]